MREKDRNKFVIVTGVSGAGKSQALKSFEDLGFHCIDNFPADFLTEYARKTKSGKYAGIALGVDVREGRAFDGIVDIIVRLKREKHDIKILFLDAADSVLISRFSQTRHKHPLGANIPRALKLERKKLLEIKSIADKQIDTSAMTLGELKENISLFINIKNSQEMKVSIVSFGFKHGILADADIVMDVRFLKNPNYEPKLKNKTGQNKSVADYIKKEPAALNFVKDFSDLVKKLIPKYVKEGKSYLTIGIGCTGGKHRSVFIAENISRELKKCGFEIYSFHRDIRKK